MAIGDVGIIEVNGSQIPGATFADLTLNATLVRNDNSNYSVVSNRVRCATAGYYLMFAIVNIQQNTNDRSNSILRFVQVSGGGNFISVEGSGFVRNNANDQMALKSWGFAHNVAANADIALQIIRDNEAVTGGTVAARSTIFIVQWETPPAVGFYTDTAQTASFGGAGTWTDAAWNNIVLEDDTGSIARQGGNTDILLQSANTRYLVVGGIRVDMAGSVRTQRATRLMDGATEITASRGHAYGREANNQFMVPLSETIVERVGTNITLSLQAGRDNCNNDGTTPARVTSSSGLMVIELSSSLELAKYVDATANQALNGAGPTNLNLARTDSIEDSAAFTNPAITDVNCVRTTDVMFHAQVYADGGTTTSGVRLTRTVRAEVAGTDVTRSSDISYLRNQQGGNNCRNASWHPGFIQAVTAGDDIQVEFVDDGFDDGVAADVTDAGDTTNGCFAIDLGTLAPDEVIEVITPALTLNITEQVVAPIGAVVEEITPALTLDISENDLNPVPRRDFVPRLILGGKLPGYPSIPAATGDVTEVITPTLALNIAEQDVDDIQDVLEVITPALTLDIAEQNINDKADDLEVITPALVLDIAEQDINDKADDLEVITPALTLDIAEQAINDKADFVQVVTPTLVLDISEQNVHEAVNVTEVITPALALSIDEQDVVDKADTLELITPALTLVIDEQDLTDRQDILEEITPALVLNIDEQDVDDLEGIIEEISPALTLDISEQVIADKADFTCALTPAPAVDLVLGVVTDVSVAQNPWTKSPVQGPTDDGDPLRGVVSNPFSDAE